MSMGLKPALLALLMCTFIYPSALRADSAKYKSMKKLSNSLYKAGKYQQSLALSRKLLVMTRDEFGEEHIETAMQNFGIGFNLIKLNRHAEAVPYYQKHLSIKEKVYGKNAIGLQFPLNHLAALYRHLGKLDKAEIHYKRVERIQTKIVGRGTSFTARAKGNLASISLKRGKWRKALNNYRQSARLYTSKVKTGGSLRVAVIDEVRDGEIRKNKDVFAGLTSALWELQVLDKKPHMNTSKARVSEALEAAQWAWRTSAGTALGRMAARLGAGDTALAKRIRALQEISQQISAKNKEGSELLVAMGNAQRETPGWTELNRTYWAVQNRLGPRSRKLETRISRMSAMAYQLKRTIGTLKDHASRARLQRAHDQTKNQINKFRAQKSELEQKLRKAAHPLDKIRNKVERQHQFEARRQRVLAKLRPLQSRAAAQNKAIINDFPGYVELVDPRPIKLQELQKLLRHKEALLVYLVGAEQSFVFAINKTRSDWAKVNLGAAQLRQIVADLRKGLDPTGNIVPTRGFQLDTPDREQAAPRQQGLPFNLQHSFELYQKLIAPVKSVLAGAKHVMLVPAGALTSLPFQVLVSKKPEVARPDYAGYKKAAWMIRDHALTVLPSVSSLRALRRFARKGQAAKLFIGYGDPVLDGLAAGEARSLGVSGFFTGERADISQLRKLSPLPDTARELQTIAARLGVPQSQVKLGIDATETAVKQAILSDYRLIHFATHGLLAGDLKGLAEPALVLTPPQTATSLDDGLLTASEAAQLNLRADWVIMSACNTASGGKPGAQALSGLARAFFYAGARALLVSHWPVYSDAATELTTTAFKELENVPGIGRAQAMRRAMLALIDNEDHPSNAHPSVWAPFIIVGEGGSDG